GLMFGSVALAAMGIAAAWHFYLNKPEISKGLAERFAGVHKLLYNKYYIDEIYSYVFVDGPTGGKGLGTTLSRFDATIVDGGVNGMAWLTRFIATVSMWWDSWVVDGAVNLVGWIVWVLNWPARVIQTGQVQRYAWWMAAGVVLLLLHYFRQQVLGS
ncbi:MAG: NADH-quinone oxidoreductase subunit L, partial [Myxococcales bacterium]|nr:NADH-quinone oxidoreductase subunit L [Myxococcales bacterium]